MRKTSLLLLFCLLTTGLFAQETIKIGGWRIHLPYNSVEQLVETPQLIYVRAEVGLYSFHKVSGEIELYSKINGLSETEVSAIAYSEEYNALVIGYRNTNIDILKNGKIINLPGVLRKTIIGRKEINEIRIYGKKAYVACTFGVVVIDLEKEDILDSYLNIGSGGSKLDILSVAEFQNYIYLGAEDGLYRAPQQGVNLSDFNSWTRYSGDSTVQLLRTYNGEMYYVEDKTLKAFNGSTLRNVEQANTYIYESIETDHNKLTVCKDSGITIFDENGIYRTVRERFKYSAILDHQDNVWTGGFYSGLIKISPSNQYSFLRPEGPFGVSSFAMQNLGEQIWVTSGGHSVTYSPTFNNAGYYIFEKGAWKSRPTDIPALASMFDFTSIAIDEPTTEVWLGTHGSGLAHFKDGAFVEHFDENNSPLKPYATDWTVCLGLAVDQNKDLWISNYQTDNALVVRRANGDWTSFDVDYTGLGKMIVDDFNTKWILVERDGSNGILAFNEGFQPRVLRTGEGRGNLPSNNVNTLVKDKDGEIWIGTETGLAVFYNPSLVFQGGVNADAQQLIIDDGNDVGYLLGNEVVNDIKIDGANRKWVATNNGVWLIEADGSAVVHHFTVSNSPLPRNEVNCIAINPVSGEVFFGTTGGIISYRSDATEATDKHSRVLVYPNPVHEGYAGPVTITGLPENATVKIADVAGRVVYELIATGGTAVWDQRSFAGEMPKTGIYLIFTANEDDEDSMVSKLMIVR